MGLPPAGRIGLVGLELHDRLGRVGERPADGRYNRVHYCSYFKERMVGHWPEPWRQVTKCCDSEI